MNKPFNPDEIFAEASRKNAAGTLTVGDTVMSGYYRLLEGVDAGRVIIKTSARIDGKSICFFANGLTWTHTAKLKDVRCEGAYPQFNSPTHEIDRSKATWYPDGSDKPQGYKW